MFKSSFTAVLLIFNTLYIYPVWSECKLGKRVKDKEFPDLSEIVTTGYTATVQITDRSLRHTKLNTEYYNVRNGKGRVDILMKGQTTKLLYFNDTKEVFVEAGLKCETGRLEEVAEGLGSKGNDFTYQDNSRIVIGPSAMLWNGLRQYKAGKVNYMGAAENVSVGLIGAEYWSGCLDNNQLPVRYYFSVKEWHNGYGMHLVNIPLRIEIYCETIDGSPLEVYEFYHFMPLIQNARSVFAIPTGIGCNRLAENLPKAPSFDGYDMAYEAELRYSEWNGDFIYVTNMNYVEDSVTQHSGYYFSTWGKAGKNRVLSANDYRFIVYHEPTGYLYNATLDKQSCTVSKVNQFDDGLTLPGGIIVNIKHNIIMGDRNKMVFLGESVRRSIPTNAFEESTYLVGDESTEDQILAIATRYYVSASGQYETGSFVQGTPVQTLLRIVDIKSEVVSEVIINIFGFTTRLVEKNELFNVESCTASSRKKVAHLTFEVSQENVIRSVRKMIPAIQEQILGLLYEHARLSPLRIPDLVVDLDINGIHAFATILERPDYLLDFNHTGHFALEQSDDTYGLYTKEQCAKQCLESLGVCRAFARCGATCYLATSETSAQKTKPDKNCHFYERLITENLVLTTDDAFRRLSSALFKVDEFHDDPSRLPSIILDWEDVKGETQSEQIFLSKFEAYNENVKEMISKQLDDFDKHFDEHQYGAKLKISAAHVKNHGRLSYQMCQMICLDDPDCQSLSSCMPLPECLTSHKYGDELKEADVVENRKCLIVTKQYVDSFVEYPGLVRVTQSLREIEASDQEKCAKSCLHADDLPCRSFDFCPRSRGKKERCLLHSVHFLDITNRTAEIKVDNETGLCGHYSRNYVRDFKKVKGKTMSSSSDLKQVKLKGITAEECAKRCIQYGGFICNSFDYCKASEPYRSSCFLNSKKGKEDDLVSSPVCNNYIREYYVKGKERQKTGSRNEKRVGKGMAAGLGILFFLVGCGLGAVIIFAYGWFVRKRM